jgi:hypothetical protein
MSRRINYFTGVVAPSCADADVTAFFALSDFSEASLAAWLSAIGKTYGEVISATCDFIGALKTSGIYASGDAMYLPIGNAAAQRKWNFISRLDSDGGNRLTFNGGITFTNFAIKGNGVNGWTNTYWNIASKMASDRGSFVIDSADDISGMAQVMGAFNNPTNFVQLNLGSSPNGNIQIASGTLTSFSGTRKGLFVSRRTGVNFNESYRDGVSLGTNAAAFTPFSLNFLLNARNGNGTPGFYAQHGVNFAYLAQAGWTATQVSDLQTAYNTYKTALGIP